MCRRCRLGGVEPNQPSAPHLSLPPSLPPSLPHPLSLSFARTRTRCVSASLTSHGWQEVELRVNETFSSIWWVSRSKLVATSQMMSEMHLLDMSTAAAWGRPSEHVRRATLAVQSLGGDWCQVVAAAGVAIDVPKAHACAWLPPARPAARDHSFSFFGDKLTSYY